jgi:hypothetical protein
MPRRLVAVPVLLLLLPAAARPETRPDPFDLYTNPVLVKAPQAEGVREVPRLGTSELLDHDRVLPGVSGTLLVVRTNDNRWSKLLVQVAWQKVSPERSLPMLVVERFVTYKEGEEQAVQASGRNVALFAGFRLNLDLGHLVPEELPADLRVVAEKSSGKPWDGVRLESVGKARMFLVTRPLPGKPKAAPAKAEPFVMGDKFEAKYVTGTYRLRDDGRRSGKLVLKVDERGEVTGALYSDKDGARYELRGRVAGGTHLVEFTVQFPRSEQVYRGYLFTGDGKALAGTSRFGERETGFYAERLAE